MPQPLTIGVLALQGAYEVHAKRLSELGSLPRLVRRPKELDGLDGLIIPGGESTTILKFLERDDFFTQLENFVQQTPTFGTCAGTILLAKDLTNSKQKSLSALDITVERNAYGRQNDSVILSEPTTLEGGPLEMVFIRAPRITQVGAAVEVLARRDGYPALVRQGQLLAATFHPELSDDPRVHQLFLDLVRQSINHPSAVEPIH
jgi:5'-phosphate synthase pdxT subunit